MNLALNTSHLSNIFPKNLDDIVKVSGLRNVLCSTEAGSNANMTLLVHQHQIAALASPTDEMEEIIHVK